MDGTNLAAAIPQGNAGGRILPAGTADIIDRRRSRERRCLSWHTIVRGALVPRRRTGRRGHEYYPIADWHEPHLLVLALGILLLSVADALLTLTLLMYGAYEANPFLAYLLDYHPHRFGAAKMMMTGFGVIALVLLARMTVFRVIRVTHVLHACLCIYVGVVAYELWLLRLLT